MAIRCVVLDFDGTFTDVVAEGAPFVEHFRRRLSEVLGRDVMEAGWAGVEAEVVSSSEEHGWEVGGRVVAPAVADPYLLSNFVARRLCDKLGVLPDKAERAKLLDDLYREAYARTAMAFKPEAKEVLEALLDTGLPVHVVTNAHTDAVEAKLTKLAPRGRERLRVSGDARKFLIESPATPDAVFDAVPDTTRVEGALVRPIYLRRGRYYEALRRIWSETDTSPETTLVAGDIFELDLALPAALGASVQLVARANVLEYERRAITALGARGGMDTSLRAILPRLRG
ncbi:HAD family hydrolase [Archangium violaceum]|uniref:HAD family hydrolase n=1 Tax=Archangium violaceum TaxID=83451 RepID=UPI0019515DA4|nr:HAD family hydrolase [Archangium violaceum]QRN98270.1 HAD family hydrolase [Archangium violaceum]